ncbi:MAG TPA: hypothetical protein VJV79_14750 [Polyangiaceae bacterium]|nr:hypothetical protein [Polyangiaceae bacterium]
MTTSDFVFRPIALMTGDVVARRPAPARQVLNYSQVANSETPLPVGFGPVSVLGMLTGSALVGERLIGTRASETERLVAGSLRHVQTIAALLPTNKDDERLIDELMAKRSAKLATRPLRRREGEPR